MGTGSIIVCSKNVTLQHTKYIAEHSFYCGEWVGLKAISHFISYIGKFTLLEYVR